MISKMIRYDILLHAKEQERFVNELRELGLVDITTTGWEPTEADRALLLEIEAYNRAIEALQTFAKGEEFKGTKIPTLDELLTACEGKDVEIALDKKIKTNNMDPLFDVVAKHNVRVSFSCADIERIETVLKRFPDAYICYDGEATDEMLSKVCALVRPDRLMVWMYLDKPNFHWLESTRKCSVENCERTKKYAKLGIANVNNPYDLKEALEFKPYCVEM